MRKSYESPSVETHCLTTQDTVMNGPTVSDNDYGWIDNPFLEDRQR